PDPDVQRAVLGLAGGNLPDAGRHPASAGRHGESSLDLGAVIHKPLSSLVEKRPAVRELLRRLPATPASRCTTPARPRPDAAGARLPPRRAARPSRSRPGP